MTDQSLNAGVELNDLDPEVKILPFEQKDEPEPEFVKENQQECVVLEHHFDRLIDLIDDAHSQRGMSQQLALEAEKLDPEFLKYNPIGYFTKNPSATLFRASLERFNVRIGELVEYIILRVKTLLKRFYNWLFRKNDSAEAPHPHAHEAEIKQLKEAIQDTVQETQEIIPISRAAEEEKELDSYFNILAARKNEKTTNAINDILNSEDPLFHDIVLNGDYSKLILRIGGNIDLIHSIFDKRIASIEEIIHTDLHTPGSVDQSRQHYGETTQYMQPLVLPMADGDKTLTEIVEQIRASKEKILANKQHRAFKFTQVFEGLHNAAASPRLIGIVNKVEGMDEKLITLTKELERLEKHCHDVSHDGMPGAMSNGIGNRVRKLIHVIGEEVANFALLVHYVFEYVKKIIYYFKMTVGLGKTLMAEVINIVLREKKEVPESWMRLKQHMDADNISIIRTGWSTFRQGKDQPDNAPTS